MDTEKLITLVQPHPCLYDCREKDYKNALKKDILWEQISKKLNQSRDAVKTKWKNLKDGYSKYKKNIKGTTGQKKTYVNWVWGPYLSFLDGAIQPRSTSSNVMSSAETLDSNYAEIETEISNGNTGSEVSSADLNYSIDDLRTEEPQPFPEAFPPPPTSRPPRKRQVADHQDILVDRVLGYIDNKEKKDSVDLLFASYATSLKRMKPMTQASVKIKLAQIFAEAELQDLQPESQQTVPTSVMSPMYSVISTSNDNDGNIVSNNVPEDLSSSTIFLVNDTQ